jgi:hypothetical protein
MNKFIWVIFFIICAVAGYFYALRRDHLIKIDQYHQNVMACQHLVDSAHTTRDSLEAITSQTCLKLFEEKSL